MDKLQIALEEDISLKQLGHTLDCFVSIRPLGNSRPGINGKMCPRLVLSGIIGSINSGNTPAKLARCSICASFETALFKGTNGGSRIQSGEDIRLSSHRRNAQSRSPSSGQGDERTRRRPASGLGSSPDTAPFDTRLPFDGAFAGTSAAPSSSAVQRYV